MPTDAYRYVLSVDGRDIELADGEVTIGRSRTSTVRIDHESVSRSHALLTLERGQAVVKDLNSSNGTYVGGRRVLNETRLADGDRLQLGAAIIAYRVVGTTSGDKTALIDAEMASAAPPAAVPVSAVAGSAAPVSPETGGSEPEPAAEAPAPVPPPPPASGEPVPPPPLEISAPDLGRPRPGADPSTPVAAHAALEAVRVSGEPPPPPPPPEAPRPLIRIPAPPKPPPVVPPRPPSLASVPFGAPRAPGGVSDSLPAPDLRAAAAPATLLSRLLAQLVDGVVLTAVNIVLTSPILLILFFRGELQPNESERDLAFWVVFGLCLLLMVAANVWYVVGGWARNGRTPGKALLKIAVVVPGRPAGTGIGWRAALLRALGTVLSTLLLGAGYVVAAVRRDRRALHDLIAGTSVVRL